MSKILHNHDAKAIAIPWVFSKNSQAKKNNNLYEHNTHNLFFYHTIAGFNNPES